MRYFDFPRTDDYGSDCAAGRAYADRLLQEMAATGATPMLGFAVMSAMDEGAFDGRHAGFFQRVAEAAASTAFPRS